MNNSSHSNNLLLKFLEVGHFSRKNINASCSEHPNSINVKCGDCRPYQIPKVTDILCLSEKENDVSTSFKTLSNLENMCMASASSQLDDSSNILSNDKDDRKWHQRNIPEMSGGRGDVPEKSDRPGDVPEKSDRPGDVPEKSDRPGDVPEKSDRPGDVPDESDRPGDVPEESDRPGDVPEESDRPGDVPEESDQPGDVPEESDRPGYVPEESDRPGDVPEESDRPGDVPEESDRPGDVPEESDRPGDVPEESDRPGDVPEESDRPGDVPEVSDQSGDVPEKSDRPGEVPEKSDPTGAVREKSDGPGDAFENSEDLKLCKKCVLGYEKFYTSIYVPDFRTLTKMNRDYFKKIGGNPIPANFIIFIITTESFKVNGTTFPKREAIEKSIKTDKMHSTSYESEGHKISENDCNSNRITENLHIFSEDSSTATSHPEKEANNEPLSLSADAERNHACGVFNCMKKMCDDILDNLQNCMNVIINATISKLSPLVEIRRTTRYAPEVDGVKDADVLPDYSSTEMLVKYFDEGRPFRKRSESAREITNLHTLFQHLCATAGTDITPDQVKADINGELVLRCYNGFNELRMLDYCKLELIEGNIRKCFFEMEGLWMRFPEICSKIEVLWRREPETIDDLEQLNHELKETADEMEEHVEILHMVLDDLRRNSHDYVRNQKTIFKELCQFLMEELHDIFNLDIEY